MLFRSVAMTIMMKAMMVIATICAFISVEKGEKEKKAKGAEPEVAPADQN